MNLSNPQLDQAMRADPALAEAVEELTARLKAGESVDLDAWLPERPVYADELRRLFPMLRLLADLSCSGGASAPAIPPEEVANGVLGDFRILREVGKGGMGIVYEAEQVSLGRRVALKVLPFAATMDPRQLQRFQNEARAAACLHHTNIVPVFFVGCERGVHFYAMQFIEGQPLNELIRQMRQREKQATVARREPTAADPSSADAATSTALPVADLTPLTGEGRRGRDYFRKVAEIGVQAAEALDHAHQLGIVHRDIKPANLLLDGRGNVWVTDFGLAHIQHGEASLTLTGQAVGTPRYMSPEQALAKRVPIDHRADVYSLGVTLYELLTLRPAFASEDRQELLRQIAFDDPSRPRRLERAIPAELEIIVLKAMEKRPQDRYATAQELADDLRHWLRNEPIHARRPSLLQRSVKWGRRHKPAVTASGLVLLMALLLAAYVGWMRHDQAARRTKAIENFEEVEQQALTSMQQEKWLEARAAAQRASDLLAGTGNDPVRQQRLEQLERDLKMAETLEFIRLQQAEVKDGHFDRENAAPAYAAAFDGYNLPVLELEPEETSLRLAASTIREQLFAALVDWSNVHSDPVEKKKLGQLLRSTDRNPWRQQVWDALEDQDGAKLARLAQSAEALDEPPSRQEALGNILAQFDKPAAVQFLRLAQQRHPDDFWINQQLAFFLQHMEPPQLEEAIGFYRAALALRPHSPGVHVNLGLTLQNKGQLDAAIAQYREAIRLKKHYAEAHGGLGVALRDKGQLDDAIAECREAIRINKDNAEAHGNLGNGLREKGLLDEAIAAYREALRLKKDHPGYHHNLGLALRAKGLLDEAIAQYREALRLKKDYAQAHYNLGVALSKKGQFDEAIGEYREAIRLKKDYAEAHNNLGTALHDKGQLDEAIAEYREAIRLKKDYAEAHNNLGGVLEQKGEFKEALIYLRRGHELGSKNPRWPYPSAQWVRECERLVELDRKLPAILSGQKQLADTAERLALAQLCVMPIKKRYVASVRFFRQAFEEKPKLADDLDAGHRYNAACAAALAGCGQGQDADKLDAKEQARLRQQALDWLRGDLKAYRQLLEKSAGKAGPVVAQRMQHWLQDTDFAGVRGDKALAKLPEKEREAWRQLWADVAQMLAKAQGKAPAEKKPHTKEELRDHTGA